MDIKESKMNLQDKVASRLFIELNDVLDKELMHISIRPFTEDKFEIYIQLLHNNREVVSKMINYMHDKYGLKNGYTHGDFMYEFDYTFYNIPYEKLEMIYALSKMGG